MIDGEFWEIVSVCRLASDFESELENLLSKKRQDEIVLFQNILGQKICDACTFPVLAANFVISSYVSDDGFLDFRAWLVSNGYSRYSNAISDPDSMADWLESEAVDDIEGALILSPAERAYRKAGGGVHEFAKKIIRYPDPKLIMDWPETKAEFRHKFPRLVDKLWNQGRIRELHSE